VVELEKVLGDQPEALEAAKKAAFDLSRQYGESSSAILLSTADFKQAGFDIVDSVTLTKNAMDLSIAGSIGSSEASEILIATLKGFKEPASEAARVVDILNEVSNKYATNVSELGIGMSELSPIANLMGFSFEETAGILTPVIEIFRSGNEAATALKMGLLKLVDDSKPVKDALAALGVAQLDANGHLRSGKDILYDVAKAFQTAEKNDKLFLAAQLVGIRQAGKMVEVFDGLAKTTEITSVAMSAAGSAALEVAARLESSEVIVNRFKEGFNNLAIVVGDQFQEAAKEAISGGTAIENALEDIIKDGTFKPVFDALGDFGIEIGEYLKGIAKAMPEAFERIDFDGLLDALDSIGGSLGELFDGLDLTDPEDLAKAIQFIVDSLESLALVTKGMVDVFGPLTENIIESIKGFNDMDDATKEASGNILAVAKAITDIGVITASLLITLGQNAEAIKTAFSLVINSIEFMWDSTVITVEGILLVVAEAVQDLLKALSYITFGDFSSALEEASEDVQMFQDSLKEDIASRAQDNLDKLSKDVSR
jgi:TP901 family phage tail tape measure protein